MKIAAKMEKPTNPRSSARCCLLAPGSRITATIEEPPPSPLKEPLGTVAHAEHVAQLAQASGVQPITVRQQRRIVLESVAQLEYPLAIAGVLAKHLDVASHPRHLSNGVVDLGDLLLVLRLIKFPGT